MNNDLRNLFSFNRGERAAIVVLLLIMAVVFAFPYLRQQRNLAGTEEWNRYLGDIRQFEAGLSQADDSVNRAGDLDFRQMDRSLAERKITPFPFDPNNLPVAEWKKMGLSDRQIKGIKNYEAKGGKFYKKEDLKKMYSISPSEFAVLEPYIRIPEKKNVYPDGQRYAEKSAEAKQVKQKALIDLNTADSAQLTTLYGIGPSFARRIIKYRTVLGGFYKPEQLLEVYGFDQDKFDQISRFISVSGQISKINVNAVSTDVLKKHPYFDYYTAKAIVDRRVAKGRYTSVEQLKEIPLIHAAQYEKICNYLALE